MFAWCTCLPATCLVLYGLRPPIPVVACCPLLRLAATVLIHTTLLAVLQLDWQQARRRTAWCDCTKLIAECKARRDVPLTVRLLLVQAEMCLQTDEDDDDDDMAASTVAAHRSAVECESGGKELSGSCRALPLLVEASKLCERAAADVQSAAVTALLARCYLALGRAADGLKAIRRILPLVLEQGSVQQLVDAMHTLALCYLAVEPEVGEDGAESVREAAAVLRVALEAAHSLQWTRHSVQLSYLYARVCNELGWLEEREKATQHFVYYSQHHAQHPVLKHSSAAMMT